MKAVAMRLGVRPSGHPARAGSTEAGLHRIALGPDTQREALAQVPPQGSGPLPLALLLHGSGGRPEQALTYLEPFASAAGVLRIAPPSRDYTWDAILGRGGPDIATVDHVLQWAFERFLVDPARIAVAGFSDGASYALALGLANGDVFASTVALSPGFIPGAEPAGRTRFFVAHGTQDRVLPVASCSRRLVPALRAAGHEMLYEEFEGGHEIPPAVAQRACGWMLGT
jgi:phospholipase/carboxylesterase